MTRIRKMSHPGKTLPFPWIYIILLVTQKNSWCFSKITLGSLPDRSRKYNLLGGNHMSMVNCPECDGRVSDLAEVCPHCGYPLKQKETQSEEYILYKGAPKKSGFATFLRVLAWITWISGLIISVMEARVPAGLARWTMTTSSNLGTQVTGGLSNTALTHFSIVTFLTTFLSYFIYGVLLRCMATIIDQISGTYSILTNLGLGKRKPEHGKPNYLSPAKSGNWECPHCKHSNNSWDEYCTQCKEPKPQ